MVLPAGMVASGAAAGPTGSGAGGPSTLVDALAPSTNGSAGSTGGKPDFRTLQNLLAALLAEWSISPVNAAAALPGKSEVSVSVSAAPTATAAESSVAPGPGPAALVSGAGASASALAPPPPKSPIASVPVTWTPNAASLTLPPTAANTATTPTATLPAPSNGVPTLNAKLEGGQAGSPLTPDAQQIQTAPLLAAAPTSGGIITPINLTPPALPEAQTVDPSKSAPVLSTPLPLFNPLQATLVSVQAASALTSSDIAKQDQDSGKAKIDPTGNVVSISDTPLGPLTGDVQAAGGRAPASVADQVGTAILARVQQMGPDSRTDLHIRLEPPDLGPMRVHLSSVDGEVSARLVVREDGTRQLLQSQLDTLLQRLSQAGISLGRFDVTQDGTGFQERWDNTPAPANTVKLQASDPVPAPPLLAGSTGAPALIDVVA